MQKDSLSTALTLKLMQDVLELEAQSLQRAAQKLTLPVMQNLQNIFQHLISSGGNLVFCGVGKSGLIGKKSAATFSSLGLPSFSLHPIEAMHGDLGRVTKNDVVVLLSKSGTTQEICDLLPFLNLPKQQLIGLLGNTHSKIAQACGCVLDCSVEKEACLNDLAPTTSTTVTVAMSDAMAVVYEAMKGISKEQFALNHPAGLLGKTLTLTVEKLLIPASECGTFQVTQSLQEALFEMTKYPHGLLPLFRGQEFAGILVEGDIRRALTKDKEALVKPVKDWMNPNPLTCGPNLLAYEVLQLMENRDKPITVMPVLSTEKKFLGLVRIHDLFRAGFSSSKKN